MVHSQRRTVLWTMGLIAIVSGLACTSAQKVDTGSVGEPTATEACFNVRNVDSFSPLHARFVYVRLLRGQQYLLTLDALYLNLPYATGITISGNFSRVCSETGARITFRDFGHPVFCRIIRVESVASREAANQLVRDRTTPKPKD